ncbi:hypothetical protein [Anaerorhabdus sp.]|uniref:hypothetical protein n=1 Tax=Anaerorhabdus sp. TaxID=1872524 RepID=UPI002B1F5E1E|nr:hypothetical protein [Anaerorhabdus sp.]MEA4875313.1 hypothetical protein [Anaerorhabdus sp.]
MKTKYMNSLFTIIFCLLVAFVFCYPFLNGSILIGPDTAFHINRIESLSIAIKNNDIFPRIFYHQNFNFGYGSPMFYSIFFLYFPAWLRNLGISIYDTYHIFLFTCAFFASLTMFKCATLVLGKKRNLYSCLSVLFYIWNCFYISDFYKRGAVGEILAFIFLPIAIMGMYHSVHGNIKKHYYLIIGFCGLLLSHNITFIITVILYAFYLMINIKTLLADKRRLITIVCIGGLGILMTCFFTFPLLEQLASGDYRIHSYFGTESLSNLALDISAVFDFRTDSSNYLCDSVGPFLLLLPLFYPFVRKQSKSRLATFLVVAGYIMVFMTTKYFPWGLFQFLSFLQFPTRLLVPATACLALGAGYTIANLPLKKGIKLQFTKMLLVIVLITNILQLFGVLTSPGLITRPTTAEEIKNDEQFLKRSEWYNLLELSTPDYLPADTSINYREYKSKIVSNNEEKEREPISYNEYNNFVFTYGYINNDAYYIMPLTYYKGYVVDIYDGDQLIETLDAKMDPETGLVRFEPSAYSSESNEVIFKVYYKGTTLQVVSAWISIITALFYIVATIINHFYSSFLKTSLKSKKVLGKK